MSVTEALRAFSIETVVAYTAAHEPSKAVAHGLETSLDRKTSPPSRSTSTRMAAAAARRFRGAGCDDARAVVSSTTHATAVFVRRADAPTNDL